MKRLIGLLAALTMALGCATTTFKETFDAEGNLVEHEVSTTNVFSGTTAVENTDGENKHTVAVDRKGLSDNATKLFETVVNAARDYLVGPLGTLAGKVLGALGSAVGGAADVAGDVADTTSEAVESAEEDVTE